MRLMISSIAVLTISSIFSQNVLTDEIERLSSLAQGTVGVAAVHLESGEVFYQNADESFPMASTYKVPIGVRLLERVDNGEISLNDMITIEPGDISPGWGTLLERINRPGVKLSIVNLLDMMLTYSDNAATDICLNAAGGPGDVTQSLRDLGIKNIRVDRETLDIIADGLGITGLPPRSEMDHTTFSKFQAKVTKIKEKEAYEAFKKDPRDQATPRDMMKLLSMIWKNEILSPESNSLIREIMVNCDTGVNRLKGKLPIGTQVAHKTGTIGISGNYSVNDVGVLYLPSNRGHVVISVYIKDSKAGHEMSETVIAEISRSIYDYFLYR